MFFDFLGSYAQVAEMETGWRTEGIAKKNPKNPAVGRGKEG